VSAGSFLDEISRRLSAANVPHETTVGTLEDTSAILTAARKMGIPDFEEHLWLGSLLETFYLMRHLRRASRGERNWPVDTPESTSEVRHSAARNDALAWETEMGRSCGERSSAAGRSL